MSKPIFAGVATALVTPFKNGEIDFQSFGRLINHQISSGVHALVVAGGQRAECQCQKDVAKFARIRADLLSQVFVGDECKRVMSQCGQALQANLPLFVSSDRDTVRQGSLSRPLTNHPVSRFQQGLKTLLPDRIRP